MPLDSVCVSALASELRAQIVGGKIDKVQQPEHSTVLLSIRSPFGNVRLALCGGVGNARVHLTDAKYENPAQPPMFCMLLRKHLVGARISALHQPERERIIIFELDGYDEMGTPVKKQLVVEMIGRGTNIILVNGDGIIIDCLRRVDAEMSSIRQVLPGLIYRLPISQTKPDFFAITSEERRALWEKYDGQKAPEKWLLETFACLSPLICREIVHRCYGDIECLPESMDALAESVERREFVPYMLLSEGKPKDFSFIRIGQYGAEMSGESFSGFSELLDAFYTRRSQAEDLHRRTQSLRKTVKNAKDRVSRKLALQRSELEKTAKRDEKRRWADLITANLYRAKGGSSITVEDFYEEDYPSVTIPLDPMKTPQQNAAAYYKEYTKAKTAERYLTELIAQNSRDEEYLSSVLDEIDRVKSETDIGDIRRELTETGYLRPQKNQSKQRVKETAPLSYISTGGYEILVGRSNTQNDRLTLKLAHKGDIWLHTQKIHGSHVVIRCAGEEVDDATLAEAASLAALHSQASAGGKVSVDYTRVKFVKKPQGSLPGMVVYTDYNTLIAEADEALAEKLKR
ncbi:MAG: fibronectin/fibrinogen-binding protein [Ruminococcaceae bacterium]|nr:fibronectin/fibrinogen-binding protein [Oscillospiraceae bacterium]